MNPVPKCARCRDGIPHDGPHGVSRYRHCRCRCRICTDAIRETSQRRRSAASRQRDAAQKRAARAGVPLPTGAKCWRCGIAFDRPGVRYGKGEACADCVEVERVMSWA